MKTFSQFVNEERDTAHVNLDSFLSGSGMKRYSHNQGHHGYVRKDAEVSATHPSIHKELTKAGYKYVHKSEPDADGVAYHTYKKPAGPMANPHTVEISTTSKGVRHVSANVGRVDHH